MEAKLCLAGAKVEGEFFLVAAIASNEHEIRHSENKERRQTTKTLPCPGSGHGKVKKES